MRAILTFALICFAATAYPQTLGFVECSHTRVDESIVQVRVYLMEGDDIYSYRTLKAGTTLKTQAIVFKVADRDVVLTAMKLECTYAMPNLKSYRNIGIPEWSVPITIKTGTAPRLGVLVDQPTSGITRVLIGKK